MWDRADELGLRPAPGRIQFLDGGGVDEGSDGPSSGGLAGRGSYAPFAALRARRTGNAAESPRPELLTLPTAPPSMVRGSLPQLQRLTDGPARIPHQRTSSRHDPRVTSAGASSPLVHPGKTISPR